MRLKSHIRVVFWSAFILFIFNKLLIRPWIIREEIQGLIPLISYSIPNFIEAVMGTFIVTGILTYSANTWLKWTKHIPLVGVSIAGVYVITQELKIHNLGGKNVYDPLDLAASILGLVFSYALIRQYGILENS